MGCWNDLLVVYMIPTGRAVSIPGDWIPPHSTAGINIVLDMLDCTRLPVLRKMSLPNHNTEVTHVRLKFTSNESRD